MNLNSEEMARLRQIRQGFAVDLSKAERDLARAQSKLEAARTKLSVADEMIATLEKNSSTVTVGATFEGLGKYAKTPFTEAVHDVINTHAGLQGMSAKEIAEILVNEGLLPKANFAVAIYITAGRLAKRNLIRIDQTDDGKRFFKIIKSENAALGTAA